MTNVMRFGMVGLLLTGGLVGIGYSDKKEECTVATEGDSPVAQACAAGGRSAAKKKMKELVKAANKAGGKFECKRCHMSTKTFELKDNAKDDFKLLLSAPAKE